MRWSVRPIPDRFGKQARRGFRAAARRQAEASRRAAAVSAEAWDASLGGAAAGADLGGSSKYSNENFED